MKKIIITITVLTLCISVYPQIVDGPSPIMGGSTHMYTYSGGTINDPVWQCSNCTIVSSYGLSVNVTWGNNNNTQGSIAIFDGSTFVASKTVSLLVAPIATAATNVASTSFTAKWTTVPAATSYKLDVSTSSSFSSFVSGYNNLTVSGTSQSVTGLTVNTTYYYRVRSYSSLGTTGNSNTITVGTGLQAPTAAAASNPEKHSFTANWGSVTGAVSYRLDVSTSISFSTFVTGYNNLTVNGTSQLVEGLATSTAYYYRVRAVNSSGNPSSNSNIITAVLAPVAQPASLIDLTSFLAKWSTVSGASGYRLDVSTVSNFSSFVSGYNNLSDTGTSKIVTGLSESTTYYYRVRAVVNSVTSEYSNTAIAMEHNYVKKVQVLKEGTKTQAAVDSLLTSERILSVSMFDGLGRSIQQVIVAGSPSQKDIVLPIAYDTLGRERYKYLPYTSSTAGIYKSNPIAAQLAFYTSQANVVHDALPVSETVFDNSPLSRVYEQGGPGLAWKVVKTSGVSSRTGHTIRYEYGTNIANDVYLWICDELNKIPKALSATKFYPAGRLFRNRIYDENAPNTTGNTNWTEEFLDKEGKVILKRSFDGTNQLNTYYVYDDLGLLRYVIPPLATITTDGSNNAVLVSGDLANLCYIYKYDKRQRMVVKKLPGADSVLMVYDLRDRLVATQDGEQWAKSPKEWLFTKYDELNRPILTGTIQSVNTRVQMQTAVNGYTGTNLYETRTTSSTHHYYTQNSFPNSSFTKTYLAVTYYDDYDIDNNGSANYTYTADTDFPNNIAFSRLRNQPAVTKVRELDPASSSEVWFTTATFYDKRYRVIQTKTTGIQGGTNLITNEVNFPGWLIKSKESQNVVQGTTTLTNYVLTRNEYDHQGRLLNTYHKINSGSEKTLSTLSYNELGQLLTKKLHVISGSGLQKMDYTYNIRGWLKKINEPDLAGGEGDFFGMELLYNEGFAALSGPSQWNGNISGMKFKNSTSGAPQKGYGFIYDQLNRLTTSRYGEGTSYTSNVGRYDENLTYDRNGNIRKLYRNGQVSAGVFGNIDSLAYKYNGTSNQVWAIGDIVTDVAGRGDFYDGTNGYANKEYYYNHNGNIRLDHNKRIKTEYNYLDLPARVIDTVNTANNIEYVYTSAGEKLKQRLSSGTTLLYLGNFVYILDGTANGIAVKYILTPEGRATYSSGAYTYEYFMKDHLGNTRISFNVPGSTAVIVQQSDYYPYGMTHKPQAVTTSDNRYLFNGKELQNNLLGGVNLDWYDYGARFYDPQTGRWHAVDPLAEDYFSQSTYHFSGNNPINFLDLNGMNYNPIYGFDGSFLGTDDLGLQGDAIMMNKKDFTQGMSHNEALDKGVIASTFAAVVSSVPLLSSLSMALQPTFDKIDNHFATLPSRPDYDGYLTKKEADDWWLGKSGQPLFVDQSKIELPGISTKSFDNKEGSSFYENFVWGLSNTGKVYGTLKLTLTNAKTGTVHLGGAKYMDEYDFTMDGRWARDFATWWGRPGGKNDGKSFLIHGYGQATVPVKK